MRVGIPKRFSDLGFPPPPVWGIAGRGSFPVGPAPAGAFFSRNLKDPPRRLSGGGLPKTHGKDGPPPTAGWNVRIRPTLRPARSVGRMKGGEAGISNPAGLPRHVPGRRSALGGSSQAPTSRMGPSPGTTSRSDRAGPGATWWNRAPPTVGRDPRIWSILHPREAPGGGKGEGPGFRFQRDSLDASPGGGSFRGA